MLNHQIFILIKKLQGALKDLFFVALLIISKLWEDGACCIPKCTLILIFGKQQHPECILYPEFLTISHFLTIWPKTQV